LLKGSFRIRRRPTYPKHLSAVTVSIRRDLRTNSLGQRSHSKADHECPRFIPDALHEMSNTGYGKEDGEDDVDGLRWQITVDRVRYGTSVDSAMFGMACSR
jgi:hypothetical protein